MQFGRPIGSFQAVKHRCADMLVVVEFAKSAAYHAAFRAAEGDDAELGAAAAMAKPRRMFAANTNLGLLVDQFAPSGVGREYVA